MLTWVRLGQSLAIEAGTSVKCPCGIVSLEIFVCSNIPLSTFFTVVGIETGIDKPEKANALSPISSTPSGIVNVDVLDKSRNV